MKHLPRVTHERSSCGRRSCRTWSSPSACPQSERLVLCETITICIWCVCFLTDIIRNVMIIQTCPSSGVCKQPKTMHVTIALINLIEMTDQWTLRTLHPFTSFARSASIYWPMVQMIPVLRAMVGSESMSNRHKCSRKVSAVAALSCCVWMKAEPMSWALVWGIVDEMGFILQRNRRTNEMTATGNKSSIKTSQTLLLLFR